jgi:hypothetical protein
VQRVSGEIHNMQGRAAARLLVFLFSFTPPSMKCGATGQCQNHFFANPQAQRIGPCSISTCATSCRRLLSETHCSLAGHMCSGYVIVSRRPEYTFQPRARKAPKESQQSRMGTSCGVASVCVVDELHFELPNTCQKIREYPPSYCGQRRELCRGKPAC